MQALFFLSTTQGKEAPMLRNAYTMPCPGRGPNSGATHDIAKLCQAVCRLHELIRENQFVIHSFRSRDLAHLFYKHGFNMAPRDLHAACRVLGYILTPRAGYVIKI